eukprot:4686431-Heterocapsa_arctica.AAC.1
MTGLTAANRTDKRSTVMKTIFAGFARRGFPTCGVVKTLTNGRNHNKSMENQIICKFWLKSRRRL